MLLVQVHVSLIRSPRLPTHTKRKYTAFGSSSEQHCIGGGWGMGGGYTVCGGQPALGPSWAEAGKHCEGQAGGFERLWASEGDTKLCMGLGWGAATLTFSQGASLSWCWVQVRLAEPPVPR